MGKGAVDDKFGLDIDNPSVLRLPYRDGALLLVSSTTRMCISI